MASQRVFLIITPNFSNNRKDNLKENTCLLNKIFLIFLINDVEVADYHFNLLSKKKTNPRNWCKFEQLEKNRDHKH